MWNKATTPTGVLGSKMVWNDFDWLRSSLQPVSGTDRYRQQADAATERYVDLVRSAMLSS
jgi:LPS sulfotransferase NodH